nr:HAMP domain-containing histidine kinase [Ktedonobacterales bacterium]
MSLRLRLGLWYGTLFAAILLMVTVLSYAFHARGHYDDLDRALITSASYTAAEVAASQGPPHLIEGNGGFRVILRIYGLDGTLQRASASAAMVGGADPRVVVRHPAGSAFDALAGLAPPLARPSPPPGSAFGIMNASGERWRVLVLPVRRGPIITGYIEALLPLGTVDASMRVFRLLLLGTALVGLAAAAVGSWATAGSALRPIARMVEAARRITRSRDLSERLEMPRQQDEIGHLARTFNEMLGSIESSYSAQHRFVSDASHELRAPLTSIQANLELLRRYPNMGASAREEALAEAERESARLGRLVADLLALARADGGVPIQRATVELDALVLDVFRTAQPLAHGQQLALDPFEPAQVRGDEDRLRQLILILLDNALKYTPVGGRVTLGLRRQNGQIEIVVSDTGIGIAPEDVPHIFERFYRADPARRRDPGGTGLGLAIAQWITQEHGGRIDIRSHLGQGTTMTVCL